MAEASSRGAAHIGSWINSIKTVVLFPALGGLMVVVGDWVVSSASSLPGI
jgi:hypothetical protein